MELFKNIYEEEIKIFDINLKDFLKKIYEASHFDILLIIVEIYLIIYLIFLLLKKKNDKIHIIKNRIYDYTLLSILVIYILYIYYTSNKNTNKEFILISFWNWSINWMNDIHNLFGIIIFTILFYSVIHIIERLTSDKMNSYSIHLLKNKSITIILTFLLLIIFKHVFHIDILKIINDIFFKIINAEFKSSLLVNIASESL